MNRSIESQLAFIFGGILTVLVMTSCSGWGEFGIEGGVSSTPTAENTFGISDTLHRQLVGVLPSGGKLLEIYPSNSGATGKIGAWVKFEFGGECFLGTNMGLRQGMMASAHCPRNHLTE